MFPICFLFVIKERKKEFAFLPGDVHASVPTMFVEIEIVFDVVFIFAYPRSAIFISKSSSLPSFVLPTDFTKMFFGFDVSVNYVSLMQFVDSMCDLNNNFHSCFPIDLFIRFKQLR